MGTSAQYSRYIRMTSSGQAINRPTCLSALTVTGIDQDVVAVLRDGGSNGAIAWVAEGDNGAGSYSINFDPPLRFHNKIYVEVLTGGVNTYNGVCLAVTEV